MGRRLSCSLLRPPHSSIPACPPSPYTYTFPHTPPRSSLPPAPSLVPPLHAVALSPSHTLPRSPLHMYLPAPRPTHRPAHPSCLHPPACSLYRLPSHAAALSQAFALYTHLSAVTCGVKVSLAALVPSAARAAASPRSTHAKLELLAQYARLDLPPLPRDANAAGGGSLTQRAKGRGVRVWCGVACYPL